MKRFLRLKFRKASSGDPQGNSAITPPPPVGPGIAAPSTSSIPTSSLSLPATGPSVATASPSSPTLSISASHDIGTWNRAYKIAEDREPELMTDYASHLASLQVNPTSKKDISNSEFVEDVVKQLLEDREKKQWRLPLLGNNVIIRKQAEKLAKALLWSDPVVKSAVSSQPYAALAWSSVSILLPLLTSAVTPDEAMLKGFNSISDVQVYWTIFEETYLTSSHRQHYENLIEPLAKLYSYIIEYQARAICHLSKTQLSRGWQNVAGGNDWAERTSEIEALSKTRSSLISHDNEKEIRERWGLQLREIQESTAILKEIRQVLEENQRQTQGNYKDMAEKDLLQDLASDYEGYKDFNRLRVQGTCEWFFNDEKFRKWRDNDTSGLLWLSAGPGCGKSILSRALIDERRLSLNVTTSTVCHFFFKDGYEDRMYGVNALCAILHQLFTRDSTGTLIKLALSAHKNYGKALTRSFSGLWNILLDCAKSPHTGDIVCIFDALDECEEQSRLQLISKLKEFYCQPQGSSELSSKLSFLITSRPYTEIEREFEGFSTTEYLHFDGDKKSPAINQEIDLVIDEHVRQIAGNFTPGDQLEISKRLKSMENRTYLWLYVIFETIKEDPSRHGKRSSIERLLNNIPSRLSEAYEVILGRSKSQEETERLLEIVLAAARPLTLDEANVALTLALAEEDFASHAALENDLWPKNNFESIVKGLSGLFISVHDSKLFLIHQTAREFLIDPSGRGTWEGRLSMSKSSSTISRTCIRFLMLPDLHTLLERRDFLDDDGSRDDLPDHSESSEGSYSDDDGSMDDILDHSESSEGSYSDDDESSEDLSYYSESSDTNIFILDNLPPFFRYAATHWTSHFLSQEATVIDQSLKDARTLCDARQAWVQVTRYRGRLRFTPDFRGMTDLSLASYFGLKQVVENILSEEHVDVNIEDESSGSALWVACIAGWSDVVTLLLNKGANYNAPHKHVTALHAALLFHHHDIVSILLENGADANSKSEHLGTALYLASTRKKPDSVISLLKWGADVNFRHGNFGTALCQACILGSRETVNILLKNGADVNIQGGSEVTALHAASRLGRPDVVIDLLNHGADINHNHPRKGTALRTASEQGSENTVTILLTNGADPNLRSGEEYDDSAISEASYRGYHGIVELLLKYGADVNLRGTRNATALQVASWKGHREIVALLLDHGADITIKGEKKLWYSDGHYYTHTGTALDAATERGHTEIMEMLGKAEGQV
ncbi:hypothetical protein N7501_004042 [Penicillium viridicatum]|nr:hypothetical protein N7501_004042 [Penicillium viridicatum]